MAVIDAIPGLKVEVIVDGARLQEYPDPEAPAATSSYQVTKYIEAQPYDTFKIWTQFLENFSEEYGFYVEIRVDGFHVSSQVISPEGIKTPAGHVTLQMKSKTVRGDDYVSNMAFLPAAFEQYRDLNEYHTTVGRVDRLGTVKVSLYRIQNVHVALHDWFETSEADCYLYELYTVPRSVCELYSPFKKRIGEKYAFDWVDGRRDQDVFATFQFKYRMFETLQSLGVVQRIASRGRSIPSLPPALSQAAPAGSNNTGLSREELIAVIKTYRRHTGGLHELTQKELRGLLEHHRAVDIGMRGNKRERDDDIEMSGRKKRGSQLIVLD